MDTVKVEATIEADGELHLTALPFRKGQRVEAIVVELTPATDSESDLKKRFRSLSREWHKETVHMSSALRMAKHPAYQEIIMMGREAVPLVLGELQRKPDHWFVALHSITGINPVPKESEGKIQEMAKAWILWGQRERFIK